ncbi:MAG: transposase [Desulfobacteraceae bacterium]
MIDTNIGFSYYFYSMPRQARIDAPGALHHIIIRGIERRKIFLDDTDRHNFLDRLGTILKDTHTSCYAWALIPNHIHLLLRTGRRSLSHVMRRLLTGYAAAFNRRHRRHGHLFQNRYKSILCQEDTYLLQLVRYIHLNPLRAKLVEDMRKLNRYLFCGHSVLMGKRKNDWQDTDYILRLFDKTFLKARRLYGEFVHEGIEQGRRADLVGGGLIRSLGGWSSARAFRRRADRMRSDERILGDGDFVESVLQLNEEQLERRYEYRARGYDFDWMVEQVARLLNMGSDEVLRPGKYPNTVKARSILCYWAARELGMSTIELSKRLLVSQPTASQSVKRGEKIVKDERLRLKE